jgi:hypothetical protein
MVISTDTRKLKAYTTAAAISPLSTREKNNNKNILARTAIKWNTE